MKLVYRLTVTVAIGMLALPLMAAEGDNEAFGQFQEILRALDGRSFETVQKAFDKTDMRNRVLSVRPQEAAVVQAFDASFWEFMGSAFSSNVPPPGVNARIKLVDFAFEDGTGKAAIRYSKPGFEYAYQVFDLRHDDRGRLKIVDWFDTGAGQMLSAQIAETLMVQMPTKPATRKTISVQNPTDLQLFQVTEIYKASRDLQPPRFYEIYDQFDETLKRDPFIAKSAVTMAFMLQDPDRLVRALDIFLEVYSEQPGYFLKMSDYYLAMGGYEEAYSLLKIFQRNFPVNEGALPAKLSALALATGKADEAEKYAVEATNDEPTLELGWWSLLRARSSAGNYAGSIAALTQLEDNFGQRLDEAKLRRDKFRGFVGLVASQEFKDWRATRP